MAPRTKKAAPATARLADVTLDSLLEGINPNRAIPEKKFQEILDHYNRRSEDQEQGLSGVKLYLFRTFPQTNNALSGRPYTNIETFECVKTAGEVNEVSPLPGDIREYVTARHGGGRYRVSLNDKGRTNTQVAQTALKIDEIEHPPILDPRELVTKDAETAGWITRQVSLGLLVRNPDGSYSMSNGTAPRPAAPAPDVDQHGMAAVAIEAMRNARDPVAEHASKAAIDMVVDAAEKMRPAAVDPVAQFTAMAGVLKGNGGDGGSGAAITALCGLMSTMMVENNKMVMLMMTQRTQEPAARQPDELGRVERLLKLAGEYGGPKPQGGGLMDMIKEWAPMILPLFLMRGMGPQQAGQIGAAIAGLAGRPGDGPAPTPGASPAPGQFTVEQGEEFAARAMAAMQRNHPGDDFALGLEVIFNPQTYDMIRQLGRDNIIAFLLQSRAGQFFAANGPQTAKFIEDFLTYGEPEGQAPGAPAPAAAPPPATPPGTPAEGRASSGEVRLTV